MFSPNDLLAFIESFAKTCRTIRDYSQLDDSHKELMARCLENSDRFKHLTGLIRNRSCYPEATWKYISELVVRAEVAMNRTLIVTKRWKRRLAISDMIRGSRAWRIIPLFPDCTGKNLMLNFKEKYRRDGPGKQKSREHKTNARECANQVTDGEVTKQPSYLKERFAEAAYMVVGKLEVTSAMTELERLLDCLNLAILTSDRLCISPSDVQKSDDTLKFVACAKTRRSEGVTVDFIDRKILDLSTLSDIDLDARTGIFRVLTGPFTGCIVDPRDVLAYVQVEDGETAWEETRNIANLFAEDPDAPEAELSSSAGILPCCGYTELDNCLHGIIFRFPPGLAAPRTLRRLLIEGKIQHSLNDRVEFAIKLATSVLVVHSLGLVHKNIKPDAILVTESLVGDRKKLYPYKLGEPHLLSFDSSRSSRGPTMKGMYPYPGGANWETLYTHPRHFGWRQYKYQMRDDVFSLGVCLLEVALWKSFFLWNAENGKYDDDTEVIDLTQDRLLREALAQGKPSNADKTWLRQQIMIETAEDLVPSIMGDLFKDVIVACLTFGDPGRLAKSEVFENRFENYSDLPPDEQSVEFVRQVLSQLKSINLS